MESVIEQIAIQVPALGIVCLVVWKLGVLAISKWSGPFDACVPR